MNSNPPIRLVQKSARTGYQLAKAMVTLLLAPAWQSQAQEYLVKNINTQQETVGSSPAAIVQVGSAFFYFKANDGVHGTELWRSDGTAEGTALVADMAAGTTSADPASLVNVNGTVFFTANNTSSGRELWRSDGTASGTFMVKDINPGPASSNPTNLVVLGSVLLFSAQSTSTNIALWASDGTDAGTFMVKDNSPGLPTSFNPQNLTVMGNLVFFSANNGVNGIELWKSDSTTSGTVMVKDIATGPTNSSPQNFSVANVGGANVLFFSANNATSGLELWKSDGTVTGTVLVSDIRSGPSGSSPTSLTSVGDAVFFSASNNANGLELWKSTGTSNGTVMVRDINPGLAGSSPRNLVNVNGTLFFTASNISAGVELWKSDGTSNGTVIVQDILPGSFSSNPTNLVNVNGTLFFSANDGINGLELWKSDGTAAGTVMVKDIRAGGLSSSPQSLANINGTLIFSADDGVYGRELWRSDGTPEGTFMVANIRDTDGDSNSGNLVKLNDLLLFSANDGVNGAELWRSDGTEAGTLLLKDIRPGTNSASPINLVAVNNILFFAANDGTNGAELWRSDGTSDGTVMVKDINPLTSSNPTNLINVNGTLFFSAAADSFGAGVWRSDGTAATTVLVKGLGVGGTNFNPAAFVNFNGTLFFTANDTLHGVELWRSDGTTEGTVMVKDINPGPASSTPRSLVVVGDRLFFSANNGTNGIELWESDGTPEGTVLVKDLAPGNSNPTNLVNINGTLYFAAVSFETGTNGTELWKSDVTATGTVLVKDILPGPGSSSPQNLINVNGTLYFTATDGRHGVELWKSDGTESGTVMVSDINPGIINSNPQNLINVNGILYFSATDGVNGRELWRSDGTAEGTFMVGDLTEDSSDSNPGPFTVLGDTLFFSAQTPEVGREVFAYVLNHPPTVASPIPDQVGVYGGVFNFVIPPGTFVDEDAGQSLSLAVNGLPPGVSFNAESLALTGVPGAAGQYVVTVTATDNGGPVPLSATNSFVITVGKATPVLNWANPADITYGTTLGTGQLNATADVPGTFVYNPAAGTVLNAGAGQVLSVSFTPEDTADYNTASVTATINVLKAPLTVTALDVTRTYGAANPVLSITYTGFVNGDTVTVLESAPEVSTTAAVSSPVGAYPITVSGGLAANYDLNLANGTLMITPALLTLTADNASRIYGEANPAFTGTVTGIQNGDNLTATYSCAAAPSSLVGNYAIVPVLVDPDNKRANYNVSLNNGTLTVTPAPLKVTITGPASGFVQAVNIDTQFSGTFTKSGYSDSYLAYWTFASDGQPDMVVPAIVADGTVSSEVPFAEAGVYSVTLTVTNEFGPGTVATNVNDDLPAYVVIYDPDGGFVTGGGWINSPAGAYLLDPSLIGRATFGFVSKYQKGANIPTGQTQFRFQVADLDFHSTSYDWLVVAGAKAQYKGSGIIDGAGDFGFMLTAVDGAINGGGELDKFRIKIWEKQSGIIVYDNQTGAADSGYPTTSLQGGSVVIHAR